jgi:hypothetical protein
MTDPTVITEPSEEAPSTALMNPYALDGLRQRIQTPSIRAIRLDGKLFKLPDNTTSPGPMRCIVLDFVYFNALYPGRYDPKNITPPACWAFSNQPDGHKPDPEVVPNPVSTTCAVCENNQWGSAATGKGKACQNRVFLAVINPEDAETGEIFRLTASPIGNSNWQKYVNNLIGKRLHFSQVTTKITFDETSTVPVLKFAFDDIHTVEPKIIKTRQAHVQDHRVLYRDPNNT